MSISSKNQATLSDALISITNNTISEFSKRNSSVASVSSELTVNPICYIDSRLSHMPETFSIVSGALTFFSSCYVSSISLITNTRVSNAMASIDRLNPKRERKWEWEVKLSKGVSNESQNFSINLFEKDKLDSILSLSSNESSDLSSNDKKVEDSQPLSVGKRIFINVDGDAPLKQEESDKKSNDGGLMLNVKTDSANKDVSDEKPKTYSLPISIRFSTYIMSGGLMTDFVSLLGIDRRLLSRITAFTSGRINTEELITLSDIVKMKKRLLLKDRDGRIKEIYNRKRGNTASGIISGSASLGTVANTVIISDKTRKEAEFNLGYKFSDFKSRENFMNESSTMILIVVDEDSEMTTMYVHSYETYSEIPISDYKKASKNDSSNITDLIRAFSAGNTPGF